MLIATRLLAICLASSFFALSRPVVGQSAEWGTLTGRFILGDALPPAKSANANPSLIVGPQGELANVVVWARSKNLPVSPDGAKKAHEPVVLEIREREAAPHIVVLRTTQPLVLRNSGSVPLNVKADLLKNASFNVLVPAGAAIVQPGLDAEESLPLPISDSIHPWLSACLLVRSNSYVGVSRPDGRFEIKNLPIGQPIEFQFWHERVGNLKGIDGNGLTTDEKGRATLTIQPGANDLGDIVIPGEALRR
jgi:hypothetical protein